LVKRRGGGKEKWDRNGVWIGYNELWDTYIDGWVRYTRSGVWIREQGGRKNNM